uniref:hypothetical protein n=1 Tax=Streptomyces sp. NRRL F-5065 TaxID=1463855 RepID=UPI001F312BCC
MADIVSDPAAAHRLGSSHESHLTGCHQPPHLGGTSGLSAIRDAFSRRVVAWEASAHADADLVLATLEYA